MLVEMVVLAEVVVVVLVEMVVVVVLVVVVVVVLVVEVEVEAGERIPGTCHHQYTRNLKGSTSHRRSTSPGTRKGIHSSLRRCRN